MQTRHHNILTESYHTSLILLLTLVLGCFQGGGFFQQGDKSALLVNANEYSGVVEGKIKAGVGVDQALLAANDSEISGTAVTFPAGAFTSDISVTLETGSIIVSSSVADTLGIDANLQVAGPSVVLVADQNIEAAQPFSVEIPVSGSTLIGFLLNETHYTVVYNAILSDGSQKLGIIPSDQIELRGNKVRFQTRYFGAYQVAKADKKIDQVKEVKTQMKVLSKRKERELPPAKFGQLHAEFNETNRSIIFYFEGTGFTNIIACSAQIYENLNLKPVKREVAKTPEELAEFIDAQGNLKGDFYYQDPNELEHSIWGRFGCMEESGRISEVTSQEIKVPAAKDNTPTYTLAFAPELSMDASYEKRLITSTDPSSTFAIYGTCDPNLNNGKVNISYPSDSASSILASVGSAVVDCNSTGQFNFALSIDNINSYRGGKEILICQGAICDHTLLHYTEDLNVVPIDSNNLLSALDGWTNRATAQYFILTKDITLSVEPYIKLQYDDVFEGDMHTITTPIKNTSTSPAGLFATASQGYIGHLNLNVTSFSCDNFCSYAGGLVGLGFGSPSYNLIIDGVTVEYKSPSTATPFAMDIDFTNSSEIAVGGLIGKVPMSVYITSSRVLFNVTSVTGTLSSNRTNATFGGLIGYWQGGQGEISKSYVEGSLDAGDFSHSESSGSESTSQIGGLIGKLKSLSKLDITDSYSNINITFNKNLYVGGFIGIIDHSSSALSLSIHQAYSSGSITNSTATKTGTCGHLYGINFGTSVLTFDVKDIFFDSPTPACDMNYSADVIGAVYGHVSATSTSPLNVNSTKNICKEFGINGNDGSSSSYLPEGAINCSKNYDYQTELTKTTSSWDFQDTWYFPSPTSLPQLQWFR